MPTFPDNYTYTVEYSAPAGNASGRYYWTNVYYFRVDLTTASYFTQVNKLTGATYGCISEAVTRERHRIWAWSDPPDVYSELAFPNPGALPGMQRVLLIDALRAEAKTADGSRWYKRLRGMLGPSDIVGGVASTEILDLLTTYYLGNLAGVALLNHRGQRAGAITLNHRVRGWQFRRGTKRANRRVLVP